MSGHIDILNRTEIRGWATRDDEKVGDVVSISVDGEEIARIPARLYSSELEAAVGVGRCAFHFRFAETPAVRKPAKVAIRSASTGILLGNGEHELPALYSDRRFQNIVDGFGCTARPYGVTAVENGIAVRSRVVATAGAEIGILPLDSRQPPPTDLRIETIASANAVTTSDIRFIIPRNGGGDDKFAGLRVCDLRAGEQPNWGDSVEDFASSIGVPFSFDWLTLPAAENFTRTSGKTDVVGFAVGGVSAAHQIYLISRRLLGNRIARVLDWGVGCGRVAVPLKRAFLKDSEVFGVDVDTLNVDWCKRNLTDIAVEMGEFYPPLDIESESIDVIYGISVMTHLSRDLQMVWLRELSRILRRGGVCILTTHGEFALMQNEWPANLYMDIDRLGISDGLLDDNLGPHLAIQGYYRGTFQLRRQVEQEWSRYLRIVAYLPTASHAHQDMIVMIKD